MLFDVGVLWFPFDKSSASADGDETIIPFSDELFDIDFLGGISTMANAVRLFLAELTSTAGSLEFRLDGHHGLFLILEFKKTAVVQNRKYSG